MPRRVTRGGRGGGNIDNLSKQFDVCDSDESLDAESATDSKRFLKSLRTSNPDKLVFTHLNINSKRNKFEMLSDQIKGNIDVLLVSETKIDDSFPNGDFLIDGFSTAYRLDRNSNGGGLMLFVREDIPSNLVEAEAKPVEGFYIELNLHNDNWFLNFSYNPHKNNIENHLKALSDLLDSHSSTYEKVLILGDFNVEVDDQNMKTFCDSYSLTSLIKQPTCYKNPSHPKCIDLILTNVPRSFQTTCVIETGLYDFHLMTLTVMRKRFKK